jgi:hypothetical protein
MWKDVQKKDEWKSIKKAFFKDSKQGEEKELF